jgi:hypothetical protein
MIWLKVLNFSQYGNDHPTDRPTDRQTDLLIETHFHAPKREKSLREGEGGGTDPCVATVQKGWRCQKLPNRLRRWKQVNVFKMLLIIKVATVSTKRDIDVHAEKIEKNVFGFFSMDV